MNRLCMQRYKKNAKNTLNYIYKLLAILKKIHIFALRQYKPITKRIQYEQRQKGNYRITTRYQTPWN